MQLTLSSESIRNAVFTNESGQVLYKTTHPYHIVMAKTTIYKIKPNDDPMDMRDQFDVIGEIKWHAKGSPTFRLDGQEMQFSEFLRPHGILGRKHTFTGPDGCPYRWDMPSETVVVRMPTHSYFLQLSRDDKSRAKLVRYHKGSLGIIGPKRKPRLDVDPAVEHMLDLIVLTFVYVEKVRRDKDD
ncbi:hypothetical protein EV363DRAFT_1493069 [Boletus edulis]|uniref:DUF6593 domain-containing protein n=1 Tax=Boletus edulis BED1 TaxID=1328754 RepID=A0AAD4BHR9_BOLED|nr:hypothetical protein EV363DRAFT_1547125 [Boletus edulis]KAF8129748.1 hypothetical protein EV363DRAFT_1493069 [Boletus edulis]KAF8429957.1 hypothetical protein L210DRAFT_3734120 [Boletus edulis BED1]